MNPATLRVTALVIAGIAVLAAFHVSHAQTGGAVAYPVKAIRFISPFAPGGSTDTLARVIGQKLNEAWGQPVLVDNRPGAGGTIAAEIVAKAPPDGYTILLTSVSAHAISPALRSRLTYDPVRDFAAVSQVASGHNILALHPSVPATSVKELIALARVRPGELTFSTGGSGTPAHIGAELFKSMAKVNMTHVPYKGGGPAAIALLSGEVSLTFGSIATVLPQMRAGKVRALAVTGSKRAAAAPDLPTIGEAGIPGYELNSWYGVVAPAATLPEIVAKLSAEIVRSLRAQDVRDRLAHEGVEPAGTTPAEFSAYIKAEIEKWAKVVKASGARAD